MSSVASLRIECTTEGFPPAMVANQTHDVMVTWDDLLWAALTVGRPNRQYVFQHGKSSFYEALFRLSLIRMALEQSGPSAYRFRRTSAARTLDPSEKGAVSYFLGLAVCKVIAHKLLDIPWLLHLDVFRPQLDPVLVGRSRPDLVGCRAGTTEWHGFECKGRLSVPNGVAKQKAKAQAQRLVSVDGHPCILNVGAITFFKNEILQFYWCDPPPERREGVRVRTSDEVWRDYYAPVLGAFEVQRGPASVARRAVLEEADIEIDIDPKVRRPLLERRWSDARETADRRKDVRTDFFYPDGVRVIAGPSWRTRRAIDG